MVYPSASPSLPPLNPPRKTKAPEAAAGAASTEAVIPRGPAAKSAPAALPFLPKAKQPSFSSHRNDVNAALALKLLEDVDGTVKAWHQGLRQVLLEIQTLYRTGPIIDGWLEAVTPEPAVSRDAATSLLRHGDAQQIAAYVDGLTQQLPTSPGPGTQYRLCSLDVDGRMQCQMCPPQQLGVISQGIARHQQLRQLVSQKKHLEARLKTAADALEVTRQALGLTVPDEDESAKR